MKLRLILLVAITVVAGWLRFSSTSFGLPDKFRPDEQYLLGSAFGFQSGWNPHFAIYPAAQMYVDHLVFVLDARLKGDWPDVQRAFGADGGAPAYLIGRRISAAFGTATIPAVYLAAAPLGPEAAVSAAALMAVSTLHMRSSRYWTTDAGAVFWLTLCLAAVMRMVYRGGERHYLAAGLLAGLAAATKYPAGIVIVAITVGHFEARAHEGRSLRRSLWDFRIYLAGFAALVAFVCATPYFFLDWPQTVHDYIYQRGFVLFGLPNPQATYGWTWLLGHAMPDCFGIAMLALFGAALVWAALKPRPGALALLAFVLAACAVMTRSKYVFYRYLLIPLPALIVLAGVFLADFARLIEPRLGRVKARAALACAVALLALPSFIRDLQLNRLLDRPDSRTVARQWIERNIPPGSAIAITDTANLCGKPQLSGDYRFVPLEPIDSLRARNVRWVLTDSFPPIEFYSKGLTPLEAKYLDSQARLVFDLQTIKPDAPAPIFDAQDAYYAPIANITSMTRAGPRIRIFELLPPAAAPAANAPLPAVHPLIRAPAPPTRFGIIFGRSLDVLQWLMALALLGALGLMSAASSAGKLVRKRFFSGPGETGPPPSGPGVTEPPPGAAHDDPTSQFELESGRAFHARDIVGREPLLSLLAGVAFVILFTYPILRHLRGIGVVWDWAEFLQRNWVSYYTITHFYQIPLWNAWDCGGMPFLAHPTSAILSPFLLLRLLFGPQVGLNLTIVAHVAIAWFGAYALASLLRLNLLGRIACASVFAGSSWFYLQIAAGHLNFLPEAFMPWVVALVWIGIAKRQITPLWAAGAVLALMFGEGGVYPCTQTMIATMLIASVLAIQTKRFWPVAAVLAAGVFGIGFGAIKLLPSWQLMQAHPRQVAQLEYDSIRHLLAGLFTRNQFYDRPRMGEWGWWESGAYLSPIFAAFAVVGIFTRFRSALPWTLAAVALFVLAIGAPYPWMPWALVHHLPVLSAERVPNRFLTPFTLVVGVCAGLGVDRTFRMEPRHWSLVVLVFVFGAVIDQWQVSKPNLGAPVAGDLPPITWSPRFHQVFLDTWGMAIQTMSNEGAVHCNEELDYHDVMKMKVIGSNQPGYRGEQYEIDGAPVRLIRWTPNELTYEVAPWKDTVVVVNENYDPGWQVLSGSGTVIQWHGLIGIKVPAGRQRITIAYRSRLFRVGALISLLTLLGALALSWRIDRKG